MDTTGGTRGTIATKDIATNDYILEIPLKLMMSPLHAFADPVIGRTLESMVDFLAV